MRFSERRRSMLAFGTLSLAAIAFEVALLLTSEPLAPTGPIAAVLDRGFESARTNTHGAPGLAVTIVRDGKIAYRFTGGYADVASATLVSQHTRFRAGSISKMLTAICAMQLVEADRLNLDAPVSAYVAEAPHARDVTIRMLLTQTSGLANFTDFAFSSGAVTSPTTPDGILTPIASQPLDFPAGTRYEYSNTNFVVLGRVIERIDGRPLAQIERERILVPAGMAESSFAGEAEGTLVATGYDDAAGAKATAAFSATWLYAAGDLVTTADDLARFDIALMNDTFVKAKTLGSMQAALHDTGDGRESYGLGFMSVPFGTHTIAGHHGGIPGFASDDEMIEGAHFAIVVLGNSGDFYTSGINGLALATLMPTDFALAEGSAIRGGSEARAKLDPAIEGRLRTLLEQISHGSVNVSTLTPMMATALTPSAVSAIADQLPPYAELKALTFQSHESSGTNDIYDFDANYGSKNITYRIVLDANGKIAGFFRH